MTKPEVLPKTLEVALSGASIDLELDTTVLDVIRMWRCIENSFSDRIFSRPTAACSERSSLLAPSTNSQMQVERLRAMHWLPALGDRITTRRRSRRQQGSPEGNLACPIFSARIDVHSTPAAVKQEYGRPKMAGGRRPSLHVSSMHTIHGCRDETHAGDNIRPESLVHERSGEKARHVDSSAELLPKKRISDCLSSSDWTASTVSRVPVR